MTIRKFGTRTFVSWTAEDLRQERKAERDEQEDSVFSNTPDWYLRMCTDQSGGWADYD